MLCKAEGKDHLPRLAGNVLPNAAQKVVGLLSHKVAWLAHVQLCVQQDPQVLFCKVAFQSVSLQPLLVPGAIPPEVQVSAFPFLNFTLTYFHRQWRSV